MNASHNETSTFQELLSTLPKTTRKTTSVTLYQYQGFWYLPSILRGVVLVQERFQALPSDIFIAGALKTGNTWLKALCFAIATRNQPDYQLTEENPLFKNLPHNIVPNILALDLADDSTARCSMKCPGLFSTHLPYTSLPESIPSSGCKIIYVCREPKDTLISKWHYVRKMENYDTNLSIEDAFERFCEGTINYGPYWDHVLGYHKASIENPDKILFLKYEDLKSDTLFYVKKLADFMGKPFSHEEDANGVAAKIVELCSFRSLSGLEVNKIGRHDIIHANLAIRNSAYFRNGETGDWRNHLSPEMVAKIDGITAEKFEGTGLTFGS